MCDSHFGRYELLSTISTGEMAEVLLARETGLSSFQRLVIIKRVLPGLAENHDFIEVFLDEARLAARLTHPNIVHIYELGEEQGSFYVAMEFVAGGDLNELLDRLAEKPLPLADSLFITGEVCAGLQFAHALAGPDGVSLGVVHRNISPQKVLLSVDGVIKIADFGMTQARAKLHATLPLDETFSSMAPEQARGEHIDRRADIYAVGALTYRLVTGTAAFPQVGDSLLAAISANQFIPPRRVNPGLPPPVEDIIMRAMALNPRDRYPTCGAMRRDLAEVARTLDRISDSETIGALVRETFPGVPEVTISIDSESPSLSLSQKNVPEIDALVSSELLIGMTEVIDEKVSPFEIIEEDSTDIVLLSDDVEEVTASCNEPQNVFVPDQRGRPKPAPAGFAVDLIEPATVRSDSPVGSYPQESIPAVGPPRVDQAFDELQYSTSHHFDAPSNDDALIDDFDTDPYASEIDFEEDPLATPTVSTDPFLSVPHAFQEEAQLSQQTTLPPITHSVSGKTPARGVLILTIVGITLGVILFASAIFLILANIFPDSQQTSPSAPEALKGSGESQVAITNQSSALSAAPIATEPAALPPESETLANNGIIPISDAAPDSPQPERPSVPATDNGGRTKRRHKQPSSPVLPPAEKQPAKVAAPSLGQTTEQPEQKLRSLPVEESSSQNHLTKTEIPTGPGYLTVFTIPSSKVYLGGQLLGNSPIAKRQVPAGDHSVKLVGPNGDKTVRITVKAGEVTRVRQKLE